VPLQGYYSEALPTDYSTAKKSALDSSTAKKAVLSFNSFSVNRS